MSYYDAVIAVLTILVSLTLVILVVGAAWWLMWKVTHENIFLWHKLKCLSHDLILAVSVKIPVY